MTPEPQPKTIDEYIAGFPPDVRAILEKVRTTIRKAAPGTVEAVKYRMPAFVLDGKNLVFFAAFKEHIGFFPARALDDRLRKKIAAYPTGKGSVQFLLDRPIPYGLIAEIVKVRVEETREKAAAKRPRPAAKKAATRK